MANTSNTRAARFRAIETLLLWEGQIENQRLRSLLGIQTVQASRVLAEYAAAHTDKVWRQTPRSPYVPRGPLAPLYSSGTIEEYLTLLRGADAVDDVIEDARLDLTAPTPPIFATVLQACRASAGLQVDYRSMTTPSGTARLIYPHAVVRAGRRWHARAWCTERHDFRDFVIGRMRSASLIAATAKPEQSARARDAGWNNKVSLVLAAHPSLDPDQSHAIRDEHFGGAVSRRISVRSCLLSYVIQDLRAAVDPARETPPEFQLAVTNAAALQAHLFPSSGG